MSSEDLCLFNREMQVFAKIDEEYSSSVQYASFVLSVIICVTGIIGNMVVIGVTGFIMKKQRSRIWFLNLAIADLLFLLCLPLNTVAEYRANWTLGSSLCKTYNYLSIINLYASIFIITALNIDRALAVAKPIWHQKCFSQNVCRGICAIIWSLTLLFSIPAIFLSGDVESKEKNECDLFSVEKVQLDTSEVAISTITSLDLGTFNAFSRYIQQCQSYLCCANEDTLRIWNRMVYKTKCLVIPLLIIEYFIPLCVIVCANITIVVQVKKSRNVKSSRLYRIIITVVITYLLSWTPIVVAEVILVLAVQNMNATLMHDVIVYLPLLSSIFYAHSCLNPIMYVLVGSQVRNGVTEFVSRVRSSRSATS